MRKLQVAIVPGGELSDITPTELGENQHVEVVNIRQSKIGEWETVKGYINHLTGASDLLNGVEVTLDETDERFLLLHSGTHLYRIDYDSGYDWADREDLTLPSDVSILSTQKLRFFVFRGTVRITGAVLTSTPTTQVPLWYGYINESYECSSGTSTYSDHTIDDWFLLKSSPDAIPSGTFYLSGTPTEITDQEDYDDTLPSEQYSVHVKGAYLVDNGQFSLPEAISGIGTSTFNVMTSNNTHNAYFVQFDLVTTGVLLDAYPRLSGYYILIAKDENNVGADDDSLVWRIASSNLLNTQDDRTFMYPDCNYKSGLQYYLPTYDWRNVIILGDANQGNTVSTRKILKEYEALFKAGMNVTITGPGGTVNTEIYASSVEVFGSSDEYVWLELYFVDAVTDAFTSSSDLHRAVTFTLDIVDHSPGGLSNGFWHFHSIANLLDIDSLPSYKDTTDIAPNSEDISPAYSHHTVIDERAYCVSLEDEESDVIRYSPLLQFDVFPNNNIIQTQVGDADSVRAIAKRNDRLMILKRHSISQGNFVGGQYAEDIGLSNNGLFATDGYFSLEDAIFWMDKDDCYMFYGTVPQPLMRDAKMRKKYRENVSSSSFIAYDKLNNELWFVLDSTILIYHIEFKEWYERQTDITPLFAFRDKDNYMIVGAASKLVNYNHSGDTFDESISYSIKTKLTDLLTPDYTKKTDEFILPIMSNQSVKVTVSDPNKTSTKSDTKTPNSTTIEPIRMRHRFLFKQLYVTISNTVASTTLYANIRKIMLKLGIWK